MKREIIEGFAKMSDLDLTVAKENYSQIENDLSFNWAKRVCKSFTNILTDAQIQSMVTWFIMLVAIVIIFKLIILWSLLEVQL